MKNKKILVIFTGGTIATLSKNNILSVSKKSKFELINLFYKRTNKAVEFDFLEPFSILSENISGENWQILFNTIKNQNLNNYCGIIITHGTDTLPYTSSVISFLFSGFNLPVVFVSSNYSLDNSKSEGIDNFCAAVDFIRNENINGFFVIFKDKNNELTVHLGTRLLESSDTDDQFCSYKNIYFGKMENGRFLWNKNTENPNLNNFSNKKPEFLDIKNNFENKIFCTNIYPDLNYRFYDFSTVKPAAVLHRLYHSSTACVNGSDSSTLEFIDRCQNQGIDVYLYNCKHFYDENIYKTTNSIKQSGAIPLSNISFEAAYAKLCVAYNQRLFIPRDFIQKNIFHEYL